MSQYLTIITGKLVQTTGLTVAGGDDSDQATCYRDGLGRLVLPGTGLAGLLIECAARVCPDVIDDVEGVFKVTEKAGKFTTRKQRDDDELRQSVWYPYSCYSLDEQVETFWEQGVGISQKTGTTSADSAALFEQECVPAGTQWSFALEIDTAVEPNAEWLAIATLQQWAAGLAPIGRSPTRGHGVFQLQDAKVYRLPTDAFEAWPDNGIDPSTNHGRDQMASKLGAVCEPVELEQCFEKASEQATEHGATPWCFARFNFDLHFGGGATPVGSPGEEYGIETLCVGGHESLHDIDLATYPSHFQNSARSEADAPFAATFHNGQPTPTISGGGIRGPVRHKASSLARGQGMEIPDPNDSKDRETARNSPDQPPDAVSALFGWMSLPDAVESKSSRLMVWESVAKPDSWTIVRTEHHAEDEFTTGTFASAKFNRDTLIRGDFRLTFQIEAADQKELMQWIGVLKPAMHYAQLGYVGLGGKKGVAGFTRWRFDPDSILCVDALNQPLKLVAEIASELSLPTQSNPKQGDADG